MIERERHRPVRDDLADDRATPPEDLGRLGRGAIRPREQHHPTWQRYLFSERSRARDGRPEGDAQAGRQASALRRETDRRGGRVAAEATRRALDGVRPRGTCDHEKVVHRESLDRITERRRIREMLDADARPFLDLDA